MERPPRIAAVASADLPVPSETDLRDFTGDRRESFLSALDDLRNDRPARAKKQLSELVRDVTNSPVLRAARAVADLAGGAIAEPREALEREVARSGHSLYVQMAYALAAQAASDFDAAYGALEAARDLARRQKQEEVAALEERIGRLRSEAARAHLGKARSAASDGDLAAALIEVEGALEAQPDDPAVLRASGEIDLRAGNFTRADEEISRALEGHPEDVSGRMLLAEAHLRAGKAEEAKRLYGELLSADPGNAALKEGLERAKAEVRRRGLPARFRDLKSQPLVTRGELAALLFESVPQLSDRPQVARGVVVTDVTGSWAKDYILMAVGQGLMDVYEDHTFGPEERVSRADLADALARAVRRLEPRPGALAPADAYPAGRIDDLPRGHGRYGSVVTAASYGLMELYPDQSFRPADACSGREAVQSVQRLAALASHGKVTP